MADDASTGDDHCGTPSRSASPESVKGIGTAARAYRLLCSSGIRQNSRRLGFLAKSTTSSLRKVLELLHGVHDPSGPTAGRAIFADLDGIENQRDTLQSWRNKYPMTQD